MGFANRMGIQSLDNGVRIYESGNSPFSEDVVEEHYAHFKADLLISLKETWCFQLLPQLPINYVPHCIIDHEPLSPLVTYGLGTTYRNIAITRFGQRMLKNAGFSSTYIPHGVNCDIFKPIPEHKKECKKLWFLDEDAFVIGIVARNQARKQIGRMLRGFKRFKELNPTVKTQLIMWTNIRPPAQPEDTPMGVGDVSVDLLPEMVELGIIPYTVIPDPKLIRHGVPEWSGNDYKSGWDMVKLYGAMDVLLATTGGEGFCLTPETKIMTENSVKMIEEISLSDKILTHLGNLKSATKIYSRQYDGLIVSIDTWCTNEPVRLSPEHPVLTSRKNKKVPLPPEWIKASDVKAGDLLLLPIPRTYYQKVTFDLSKYSNVQFNDQHVWYSAQYSPRKKEVDKLILPRHIILDKKLARLIGWYISEGDAGNLKGIGFSLNRKEVEYATEIKSLLKAIFAVDPLEVDKKKRNCLYIWVSSKILADFFSSLAGKGAKNKRIPKEILYGSEDILRECLDTVFKGDGGFCQGYRRYTTASQTLAYQYRIACLKLGYPISVSRRVRNRKYHTGEYYRTVEYVLDVTPETDKTKHSRKSFKFNERYIAYRVRKTEMQPYQGTLCNLEIEDDNTYCTANFVVHNCMPLIEAQATGIPVIGTDYAGGAEQVGAGLTVPWNDYVVINTPGTKYALCDIEKMAEALTKIYNADREKLAKKARAFALRYDWNRVMSDYWQPFLAECEPELHPLITKEGTKVWA